MRYNIAGGLVLIGFLTMSVLLVAVQAPYIPSYDDRYEEDMAQANSNKNYFNEPGDAINYAQYHYVGAHAAQKYKRFCPEYPLQDQPIPGLLTTGVRGLMIGVFNWELGWSSIIREGLSVICSDPRKESTVFRKNGKPLYQTLHYEMNRIFNFLKSNPKAVITILFDDYADTAKILQDITSITMKNNYDPILKPSDWPAAQQKGEWSTLGWMRSNNKRLVLFTRIHKEHTNFTWPMKNYFCENMAGTMNENIACSYATRFAAGSNQKTRSLVSFGCYGNVSVAPDRKRCFDYNAAKNLTRSCQQKNFARGKLFNGYWADYVISIANTLVQEGKKTLFDYVNELNAAGRK